MNCVRVIYMYVVYSSWWRLVEAETSKPNITLTPEEPSSSDSQSGHFNKDLQSKNFAAWMETLRQTNGDAITVNGQKPILDNSMNKDRMA